MVKKTFQLFSLSLMLVLTNSFAQAQDSSPRSAVAMHGTPKYKDNFKHFDYVNPNAAKGGTLKQHVIGTFDSLNPYVIKGVPAAGLSFLGLNLINESLVVQSYDEPFSQYGSIAQTIEIPQDKSFVVFDLHPEARWHDGKAITVEDVIWSFKTLMNKGPPLIKAYYGNVENVEKAGPRKVKFSFSKNNGEINAELPLIMGQLPILPKHYWTGKDSQGNPREFGETTLEPPLGSGPYKITDIDPGTSITYEKAGSWWAKDLAINKGRYNFDRIVFDYYRDNNVALEAFLSGEYDVREENTAKLWATAYDTETVKSGKIIKEEIPNKRPAGMQGFVYNIRRDVFQDLDVRKALDYAFDFEWSNKQFAYGVYKRTDSYFENSELAARKGEPEGKVLEILQEFRDDLSKSVFNKHYTPPESDGSGNNRKNLREAIKILENAGYKLNEKNIRQHVKSGDKLEFEILLSNPQFKRWTLPFINNLKKIGVKARLRIVDTAQYQNRIRDFDFDMTVYTFAQSSSPGNEQRDYWGSGKADLKGSRNIIGVQNPVIDKLIEKIINASDRQELIYTTRALDRVLLAYHYVIPHWHISHWRVAYANDIKRPENPAPYSLGITDTWWHDKKGNKK
mgnify:CR=1 FL=1